MYDYINQKAGMRPSTRLSIIREKSHIVHEPALTVSFICIGAILYWLFFAHALSVSNQALKSFMKGYFFFSSGTLAVNLKYQSQSRFWTKRYKKLTHHS